MNIVVTGASRGIGLELAAQALRRKDRVLCVARDPGSSPGLAALKREFPEALEILQADVASEGAPARIAKAAASWGSVDVLINNAGVYEDDDRVEDFIASFRVNSVAPLFVTRALFPMLRKSEAPKAIHVTSLMGSIEDNGSGGSYSYRASKAALNMIGKTLSIDEPWLTTLVIHPGWVQTRMGGAGAPTPVAESASGIWKVIDGLKPSDSGGFRDYENDRLPW